MATDKNRMKQIIESLKTCCDYYFYDDYYKTAKKLIDKLKKNKEFSMDKGKVDGWVAGLLYIVGEDSGLFNNRNMLDSKLYLAKVDVAEFAGVSATTMRNRAADIREALPENARFIADISYRDDVFGNYCYDEIYYDDIYDEEDEELEEYEIYFNKAISTDDVDESMENMKLALKLAKENVSPKIFKELEGDLWLDSDARVYLYIKEHIARLYEEKGEYETAIEIYNEILKLNKADNQSIRYKIFPSLIYLNRKDEIENLLKKYEIDVTPFMLYNEALYHYIDKNKFNAKSVLRNAIKNNTHIPEYLFGMKGFDFLAPEIYSWGSEEEAIIYFELSSTMWAKTEGALYWLLDEYFTYTKKEGIELKFSKDEFKGFIDEEIERVKNI